MAALIGLSSLTVDDICSSLATRGVSEEDIDRIRGKYGNPLERGKSK
jgi:hypothetical protein